MIFPSIDGKSYGLQCLRFFAAVGVLLAHISFVVRDKLHDPGFPLFDYGLIGVDIFFVISGVVMAISVLGRESGLPGAWEFFMRRVVRIVPLYWIATTLKLIIVLMIPSFATHSEFDGLHTLLSYFFIHAKDEAGAISPLHSVGWTLNYEMFFYFVITLALALRFRVIPFISVVFVGLVVLGIGRDLESGSAAIAYLQPITLQFVFGFFIGHLQIRKALGPIFLGSIFLVVGGVGLFFSGTYKHALGWDAFFGCGVYSAMLVYGLVAVESKIFRYVPKTLILLGDASYSLYLFHPFFLGALALVCMKLGFESSTFVALIFFCVSIPASVVVHLFIERPLTNFFTKSLAK